MLNKIIQRFIRSYKLFGRQSPKNYVKYLRANHVEVGNNVLFRYPKSTKIDLNRPELIELGSNLDINANFTIMIHDFGCFVFRNLFGDFVAGSGKVKIGNNVYIARDVTVCRGGEIGDNSIVGIGSTIMKKMPPNSVIAGTPAKVICSIEEYYLRRKKEQLLECRENAIAFLKRFGRKPTIMDFKEEWCMFITKQDLDQYPEVHSNIDWRLKDKYNEFFEHHTADHIGFDEFFKTIPFNDGENINNNPNLQEPRGPRAIN